QAERKGLPGHVARQDDDVAFAEERGHLRVRHVTSHLDDRAKALAIDRACDLAASRSVPGDDETEPRVTRGEGLHRREEFPVTLALDETRGDEEPELARLRRL